VLRPESIIEAFLGCEAAFRRRFSINALLPSVATNSLSGLNARIKTTSPNLEAQTLALAPRRRNRRDMGAIPNHGVSTLENRRLAGGTPPDYAQVRQSRNLMNAYER
jgi:hypothetical protein